jgi:hypothetical protein
MEHDIASRVRKNSILALIGGIYSVGMIFVGHNILLALIEMTLLSMFGLLN